MNKTLITITLIAATIAANAQNTQKLTANKASEYGLVYTLPLNTVEVTLSAEKTVMEPGEFALYAKKLLHLDPILKHSVSWRLTDGEIIRRSIADPDERYLVQFKNGSSPYMLLSDEGFPIAVNDESAGLPEEKKTRLKPVEAAPTPLETDAAKQAVTEEMIRSTSTAKRAGLAAARIYEIRQQRSDIISGQADAMPGDGHAMQLALDNLKAQEEALTAMFTGTVKRSTATRTFTITPPLDDEPQQTIIARLSAIDGIVDADNLAGVPVTLTFSGIETAELPVNEKGIVKSFPKGGLAYRIPGSTTIVITHDGHTIATEKLDIAQYGVVFGLDPGMFTDKKSPAYLQFDPATGAVRELGTQSAQQ